MRRTLALLLVFMTVNAYFSGTADAEETNGMNPDGNVAYIEFTAPEIAQTKAFFVEVFGWTFTDWGPDYIDTPSPGVMIGFSRGAAATRQDNGGAVIGFYSDDLAATAARVTAAGGSILKPAYAFPGGERFHFLEPSGNEFIVYTGTDSE